MREAWVSLSVGLGFPLKLRLVAVLSLAERIDSEKTAKERAQKMQIWGWVHTLHGKACAPDCPTIKRSKQAAGQAFIMLQFLHACPDCAANWIQGFSGHSQHCHATK